MAAVNGPASTIVSGDVPALLQFAAAYGEDGIRTRPIRVDYASHCAHVERVREQILTDLDGIVPQPPRLPMISAMTGEPLDASRAGTAYWYDSLRAPVDFERAIRTLAGSGHRVFIEVSPHPVLAASITETLEDADVATPVVATTLRRTDGGARRFLASLAEAHVRGIGVDWTAVLAGGQRVDLPTYEFQRERYWPRSAAPAAAGVAAAGLDAVGHPLLGAAVTLAAGDGYLFTGRLSVHTQPWLADHAVNGTVLLPGTAFVELAVRAGDQAGCGHLDELTLEAPLLLPPAGAVQIQVTVGGKDQAGRRPIDRHGRAAAEQPEAGQPWVRHASGQLSPSRDDAAGSGEFTAWPPADAVPVDVTELYAGLAAAGYGYGPAFRGLRAAWRRGDDVFADVTLDGEEQASSFCIHPALLDAALHATALLASGGQPDQVRLPFAWTGVSVHAAGASQLRVRLSRAADGALSLVAPDVAGAPVVSVDALVFRPVGTGQLRPAAPRGDLFAEQWVPVAATGDPGAHVTLARARASGQRAPPPPVRCSSSSSDGWPATTRRRHG